MKKVKSKPMSNAPKGGKTKPVKSMPKPSKGC